MNDFPSALQVALAGAVVVALAYAIGRAAARLVLPGPLSRLLAPAVGLALYAGVAAPVFLVLPFNAWTAAGLLAIVAIAAQVLGPRLVQKTDEEPQPSWPMIAAAAVLAVAPALTVFPQIVSDAVGIGLPIFDHGKTAIIMEIHRAGLPPHNPFFGEAGVPDRLYYYYLWYLVAAHLTWLPGISAWEADIALTWATAFSSLLVMIALATVLARRAAAGWWVLALALVAPLAPRPISGPLAAILNADYHALEPWSLQAAWVPQHLFAATAALLFVIAFVRVYRAPTLALPLAVTAALSAAAAYGSSAWVGGLGLACIAACVFVSLTAVEVDRPAAGVWMTNVAVAALITAALALPFLRDQSDMLGIRSSRIVEPGLYPVFRLPPDSAWWPLDIPGYWLVLLVVSMPGIYPFGLAGMVMTAWRGRTSEIGRWAIHALAVAAPCFVLPQVLRSIIANNDFGWRLVLPGMLVSIVFAAVFFARAFAAEGRAIRAVAALGAVMVLAGMAAGAWFFHGNALAFRLQPQASAQARAFLDEPAVWEAVRRLTPAHDRVANNPAAFDHMTGWPTNIGWALFADRRSCAAGWEWLRAFVPQRPQIVTAEIERLFRRVFAGEGSGEDVRRMRETYGCDTVLVVPADGLWAADDVLTAAGAYRLVEERPDRWRIYRAAQGR